MSDVKGLAIASRQSEVEARPVVQPAQPRVDAASLEATNAQLIAENPLFDAQWYESRNADMAASGLNPALHYLRSGAAKGLAPSPDFDGADYLDRYKDVSAISMNPLLHYIKFGKSEKRLYKPADTEELNARQIAASEFFDEAWYKASYPEVARSRIPPARYFLKHGRKRNHNPSPKFDLAHYIASNADIATSTINPLLHYLNFGRAEGRPVQEAGAKPKPPENRENPAAPAAALPPSQQEALDRDTANSRLILQSPLFDADWYVRFHLEVRASGMPPELHYLKIGGLKGLPASTQFDSADYLRRYGDVHQTGINPLMHYLQFGMAERRKIRTVNEMTLAEQMVRASGLFDEPWYTATYPTVLRSKLSPLQHYLKHGREKAHNPGPLFDAVSYLAGHQDIIPPKINPLLHYLQSGQSENRAADPAGAQPSVATSPPQSRQTNTIATATPKPPPAPNPPAPQPTTLSAPQPVIALAPYNADDLAGDIALLEATPLFDKAWYFNKYPDAARLGIGAAEHYLRHGALEMRQPSIYFDPQYYLVEQSPELQGSGFNPLVHFLRTGRDLGRKPCALLEFVPSPKLAPIRDAAAWPIVAGRMLPQTASPAWIRQQELEARAEWPSLKICGTMLAFGSDLTAVAAAHDRLLAFATLSGFDPSADLLVLRSGTLSAPQQDFQPRDYTGIGPELSASPSRILDCWFASDNILRLRLGDESVEKRRPLVIRAFQCDPTQQRRIGLVGEIPLSQAGTCFADINLLNPFMPLLLVLTEAPGQAVELGVVAFPSLCRGGLHYSEVAGAEDLSNPFDQLQSLSDRLVKQHMAAGVARLISRIDVDITDASGAEPIFQPAFGAWVLSVFGIGIAAANSAAGNPSGEAYLTQCLAETPAVHGHIPHREGQYRLALPADAIPTIQSLVAGRNTATSELLCGNYYVADAATARPRLSVVLPQPADQLLGLQPQWAPPGFPLLRREAVQDHKGGEPAQFTGHAAIRLPRNTETTRPAILMALAPDAAPNLLQAPDEADGSITIDAFVRASDAVNLEVFIRSLNNQRGIVLGHITVEAIAGHGDHDPLQSVLDRLLPGKADLIIRTTPGILGPDCLIDGSANAFTLIAEDTTVLHDRRTVEALLVLARSNGTASAGCVIIRESMARKGSLLAFESGGYFPSHVSLHAAPRLILSQPDCRAAFPNTTYPVVANSSGFMLVRNTCLHQVMRHRAGTVAPAADDGLEFALGALGAGYRHLCTSVVRAASLRPQPKSERSDPPGLAAIAPAQWSAILAAVAIVREIR